MAKKVAERLVTQALGVGAKFILVELVDGKSNPVYDHSGQLLKFDSGKEAATVADRMSLESGNKVQPRRVNDDEWRKREEDRMKLKDYLPLPWAGERWWLDLKPIWQDHYPHASVNKEAFIAFTESAEKGMADVQTPIKPGRYLEAYFGQPGILSPHAIRNLCSQFSNVYEANIVLFAETADEVEDVYLNGPSSCMSKAAEQYNTDKLHPTKIYAMGGDLKVAYLRREGRVVARTIAWPEKKVYNSSVYGDRARIEPLLAKLGYKPGSLNGARLGRKAVKAKGSGISTAFSFVVPHVDNCSSIWDDGKFLVLGAKDKATTFTFSGGTGLTEPLLPGCPSCNTSRAAPIRSFKSVIMGSGKSPETAFMCDQCVKDHAFHDEWSGSIIHNEQGQVIKRRSIGEMRVWKRWEGEYYAKPRGRDEYYELSMLVKLRSGVYVHPQDAKDLVRCKCGKMLDKAEDCDKACRMSWDRIESLKSSTLTSSTSSTLSTTAGTYTSRIIGGL